ncbi:PIN domain-containing protein [Thermodesulfatator autotrophicus]|uniref:Ribonuclease VapC n=1 Tax=Thermodesulfatator autotrophicus TaxID=1795632 RepID=A0A177E4X3_9BACT|nr:PIN domain-containing protein [Thermodesulfatator autotrophicus]OAG27013.1 twitching motility protein PilT [Thermodesulfatator autotrophicus]
MRSENRPFFLLDTSAWLAYMEEEEGVDRVEEILKTGRVLMPFMVLLEIYYISYREKGEEIANRRYALLKSLDIEFLWNLDEPILLTAGRFKALHRLSLADAIIAAAAKIKGAILVHKDPEYEALGQEVDQEILPYKKA